MQVNLKNSYLEEIIKHNQNTGNRRYTLATVIFRLQYNKLKINYLFLCCYLEIYMANSYESDRAGGRKDYRVEERGRMTGMVSLA
jgi:hypothetical protein